VIQDFKQWWRIRAQTRAQMRAVQNAVKQAQMQAPVASAPPPPKREQAPSPHMAPMQKPDDDAMRVLMVCMGNVCRSPIAEGVLRAKLHAAGLGTRVLVDSAGTHGYHTQEPPDPRSIRAAAQRGYDIAGQRARPVLPEDFTRFDWLLAMDSSNLAWLQKRKPEDVQPRMDLLMAHAQNHPGVVDVPDPYYGPDAGFEVVLDYVEAACDGVVAQLRGDLQKARAAVSSGL
jgi:protein-tyrosine phosphatase